MTKRLPKLEARMIELAFVEEQRAAAKRRRRHRIAFAIGLCAIFGTLVNSLFLGRMWMFIVLFIVWLASVGAYTMGRVFPGSYLIDADVRWHINPWRDALENLVSEDRHIPAIILLAAMPICLVVLRAIDLAQRL